MRLDCSQLDAGAVIRPVPGGWHPRAAANSVNTRSLPGFLNLAMRRDIAMSDPAAQPAIVARVQAIQTRGEAAQYIQQVQAKMRAAGQSLA